MSRVYGHLGTVLVGLNNLIHASKIEHGIHTLAVEVHRHGEYVHIAGALTVAHQGAFHTIGAGHDSQLGGGDSTTAIIVGVGGNQDRVAAVDTIAEVLNLVGIDVGCTHLNGRRQIHNRLVFGGRLPDVDNRIANLDGVVEFGAGETLRRVFEYPIRLGIFQGSLPDQLCTFYGDFGNAFPALLEDLLALYHRGRVVHVQYRAFRSPQGLEGFLDQLWTGLG